MECEFSNFKLKIGAFGTLKGAYNEDDSEESFTLSGEIGFKVSIEGEFGGNVCYEPPIIAKVTVGGEYKRSLSGEVKIVLSKEQSYKLQAAKINRHSTQISSG